MQLLGVNQCILSIIFKSLYVSAATNFCIYFLYRRNECGFKTINFENCNAYILNDIKTSVIHFIWMRGVHFFSSHNI